LAQRAFAGIVVSFSAFGTGRTNVLYGFVHLAIFATFVFLVLIPEQSCGARLNTRSKRPNVIHPFERGQHQ
jgi:hypothetical protein